MTPWLCTLFRRAVEPLLDVLPWYKQLSLKQSAQSRAHELATVAVRAALEREEEGTKKRIQAAAKVAELERKLAAYRQELGDASFSCDEVKAGIEYTLNRPSPSRGRWSCSRATAAQQQHQQRRTIFMTRGTMQPSPLLSLNLRPSSRRSRSRSSRRKGSSSSRRTKTRRRSRSRSSHPRRPSAWPPCA